MKDSFRPAFNPVFRSLAHRAWFVWVRWITILSLEMTKKWHDFVKPNLACGVFNCSLPFPNGGSPAGPKPARKREVKIARGTALPPVAQEGKAKCPIGVSACAPHAFSLCRTSRGLPGPWHLSCMQARSMQRTTSSRYFKKAADFHCPAFKISASLHPHFRISCDAAQGNRVTVQRR